MAEANDLLYDKSWNRPKTSGGIETRYLLTESTVDIFSWNRPKTSGGIETKVLEHPTTTIIISWNRPKTSGGIETYDKTVGGRGYGHMLE